MVFLAPARCQKLCPFCFGFWVDESHQLWCHGVVTATKRKILPIPSVTINIMHSC